MIDRLSRLRRYLLEDRARRLARIAAFVALASVFTAMAMTIAGQAPVHALHVSGCLTYTSELANSVTEGETPPRLVSAMRRPRWGLEWSAGRFLPLEIDGHIGALPSYPFCRLIASGGVVLARASLIASGCLTLLLMLLIGRLLAAESAGWIAAALAATSPQFLSVHGVPIPYEVWSFLFPALALFLVLSSTTKNGVRTWAVAALCLGIGVSSKQTATWALLAVLVGAVVAGWRPRPTLGRSILLGSCFLVPLIPQVLQVLAGPATAFRERMVEVGSGAGYLSYERLSFFVGRFYDCFVRMATFNDSTMRGTGCESSTRHVLAGAALLLLLVGPLAACVRRRLPARVGGFVAAFWTLLAAHYVFYYQGYWLYELLTPWVPLALGVSAWLLWTLWRGPAARAITVACVAVLAGNQLLEDYSLGTLWSLDTPVTLATQEAAASELAGVGTSPWMVTSSQYGVFETLSDHEIRPRYLDDLFVDAMSQAPAPGTFDTAWSSALDRMGPGRHVVLVPSYLGAFDIRDETRGQLLFQRLEVTAQSRGGTLEIDRAFTSDAGRTLLRLVEVDVPESDRHLPSGSDGRR